MWKSKRSPLSAVPERPVTTRGPGDLSPSFPASSCLRHVLFILLTCTLFAGTLAAQQLREVPFGADGDRARPMTPDEMITPRLLQEEEGGGRGRKSGWLAVGLSAVLPGAGQAYTENYWKIPVIWGLGGYWIYEWTRNNDRYRDFRDQYSQSMTLFPPYGDERLLNLREFYRDQRDSFTWYLGLLYFLNIVDAYVGAQLYDFDVGPDLGAATPGVHAMVRVKF